jgi:ornithine decarboxylase
MSVIPAATPVAGPSADRPPTPYLRLDVAEAVASYRSLASTLPADAVHYAVKANPEPTLLAALAAAGSCFDVASPAEVLAALEAGAGPSDLVYSNPVKRRADIGLAAQAGVDLFVVDSIPEAHKVADAAPGSSVLCRLATTGHGSDWSLSGKYGANARDAVGILRVAAAVGLRPAGLSFHVGSQQRDPAAWDEPIATAAEVFAELRRGGFNPWLLDLGGGFPAQLEGATPPLLAYGATIDRQLHRCFGDRRRPRTLVEPGRAVVADAGILVATVLAVVERGPRRWVYLDAGVFTGLVETLDEAIRYRLLSSADGGLTGPCVLAGPTCDSADILYQRRPVRLPLALAEGDTVTFLAAGAYTTCYSTAGFNGFPPLRTELA